MKHPIAMLIVAGAIVTLSAVWPREAPTSLTEERKQLLVQRLHTEVQYGQLLYNLPELMPPTVTFDLRNDNAAESVCAHRDLARGNTTWSLRVDERIAAAHWRQFLSETLPHEAAHLLRCQSGDRRWPEHDARWETIVRDLGATPAPYHRYD